MTLESDVTDLHVEDAISLFDLSAAQVRKKGKEKVIKNEQSSDERVSSDLLKKTCKIFRRLTGGHQIRNESCVLKALEKKFRKQKINVSVRSLFEKTLTWLIN